MDILVTGISGFLGKKIYNSLKTKHNVFGITNSKKTKKNKIFKVDLTSRSETKKFLLNSGIENIDIIIHFAFKFSNDFETFNLNNKISLNVLEISNFFKPKTFFNISSIRVYENSDKIFDENSSTNMYNNQDFYYGLAKKCSEEILRYESNNYTKIINLRLAQVYDKEFEKNKLFKEFKNQLKLKNQIEVWGKGKRASCFISVKKFNDYLSVLINHDFKESLELNLGEENLLYLEVAKKIISKYGNKDSKVIIKDNGICSSVQINTNKLKNILNEKS